MRLSSGIDSVCAIKSTLTTKDTVKLSSKLHMRRIDRRSFTASVAISRKCINIRYIVCYQLVKKIIMEFRIEKKLENSLGRAGILETPHGFIQTPAFVPVGTKASVKALTPEQVLELGAEVVLANTYHLYLQPGDEIIAKAGGLHKFMNWHGPIITDSGGFQVFSLGVAYGKDISKLIHFTKVTDPSLLIPERFDDSDAPRLAKIGQDGVSFKSHLDGSVHYITPEKSIQIQHNLGADIIFAFDECTSPDEDLRYQEEALERTHRWAERSLAEHKKLCSALAEENIFSRSSLTLPRLRRGGTPPPVAPREIFSLALFGIVQGGRE